MSQNFLSKYVSLFEGTEVPERFAIWCGISCVSAVLERRVFIDVGVFTVYPNTYIILVAESGRCRKSTAIKLTEKLLHKISPGPRLIAQKITPEALIQALRVVRTDDPKELLKETCGGVVLCDELMSFLNKDSYERGLSGLLIPFYDCKDDFTHSTRAHGNEEVKFAHLSLLGASTIHALREAVPIKALGDGLSSRILFVYTNQVPEPVPWPEFSAAKKATEESLINHLQRLTQLEGKVTLSPEARKLHDEEYIRFNKTSPMFDDPHLCAYASRRAMHWLKTAVILMACEDGVDPQRLVILPHHLQGAKVLLEDIEPDMASVFDQIVTTDVGTIAEKIYEAISKAPGGKLSRSELLRKFSSRINSEEAGKHLKTLTESKRIYLEIEPPNTLMYIANKETGSGIKRTGTTRRPW